MKTTDTPRALAEGSCHCGAVRFRVALDLKAGTTRCNCRYCTKNGWWGVLMAPEHFTLLAGADALEGEAMVPPPPPEFWGERRRCGTCGVLAFGRGHLPMLGGDFVSVNVRCFDDIDLTGVPVRHLDGKHDTWAELVVRPWRDPFSASTP